MPRPKTKTKSRITKKRAQRAPTGPSTSRATINIDPDRSTIKNVTEAVVPAIVINAGQPPEGSGARTPSNIRSQISAPAGVTTRKSDSLRGVNSTLDPTGPTDSGRERTVTGSSENIVGSNPDQQVPAIGDSDDQTPASGVSNDPNNSKSSPKKKASQRALMEEVDDEEDPEFVRTKRAAETGKAKVQVIVADADEHGSISIHG
ncbi:hypothetical protein B0H16DRAFT_1480172 [Mycena metata]|nr:hypothetical protein B0H16DRAFT_1480172 [Mycena metata]